MKKILTLLLAAAICLSGLVYVTPQASAASQDETAQAAAVMNMMGAIEGDGSGSLGLNNTLTRAQFCKIAVVALGLSAKVSQYSGYTIFPDVLSSDWEAGYVNVAVRYAGIMSGYADGTFKPDNVITYKEVVTVLVRMLGYADSDVGSNWPYGHINKADEIGLTDGVSLSADDTITKGEMAILFVNMLNIEMNNSTQTFMETISGATVIKNVFLMSANAETDTGVSGAVEVAGTASATYLPVNEVPDTLVGLYGSLILNSAGKALTFVPATSGTTVVSTVKSAEAGYIECTNGMEISMTGSPVLYFDGSTASYASLWTDITSGMRISAYYTEGGTAAYVMVTSSSSAAESIIVVTSDTYSLPATASVYINGTEATPDDIIKCDVIEYDADYNAYNVTRKHITGRYESADPNASAPDTVTVLGKEFTLLDSAVASAMAYDIGDTIMLLLTSENKVADVVSVYKTNINYGVVKSISSSSAAVELLNGITVTGSIDSNDADFIEGQLVYVVSSEIGYLNLGAISEKSYSYLNISTGMLGNYTLSNTIKVFDCAGDKTAEITLSDIPSNIVPASDILFAAFDWSGKINLLVLGDVTGDAYTYGFIKNGTVTQTSGSMSATNPTTSVTNSSGTTEAVIGTTGLYTGCLAGVAVTGEGKLAGYVTLTAIYGVGRDYFEESTDGTFYVSTGKGLIQVSDDVQVYMDRTDTWTTLDTARAVSDNMTVYYDRTLSTGGKVRVIIAY